MYQGVKAFIASYKEPFDRLVKAKKKARERLREKGVATTTKVGKEAVEKETLLVLEEWDQKAQWGTDAHNVVQGKVHQKYPDTIIGSYQKADPESVIDPTKALDINSIKPNTRYTEKQILDPMNKLIGYVDELYVDKKWNIHITEYKSSSNLNRGFTFMTPKGPMSLYYFYPIDHFVDCNFNAANLQASFYMYMLWYYNKKLKPGKIIIKHIKLNEETGAIESIEDHDAPYLIDEVKQLLKHKKK